MEVRAARDERDVESERERRRGESAKGGTEWRRKGDRSKIGKGRKSGGRGKERKIEERNSGRMKGGRRERDRERAREEYNIDRISVAADSIYPLLTGLLLSRI